MQMISLGSARASRVDRGALAPVGAHNCSLNGGDSSRPTRTAGAGREAAHLTSRSIVRPQHARRALPNPTESLRPGFAKAEPFRRGAALELALLPMAPLVTIHVSGKSLDPLSADKNLGRHDPILNPNSFSRETKPPEFRRRRPPERQRGTKHRPGSGELRVVPDPQAWREAGHGIPSHCFVSAITPVLGGGAVSGDCGTLR